MDKIYPLNEYDNNPSMHSAQRFYLFQNFLHDDKLCNVDLLLCKFFVFLYFYNIYVEIYCKTVHIFHAVSLRTMAGSSKMIN